MKQVIKLTNLDGQPILIGVESIIQAEKVKREDNGRITFPTKIKSRGGMVETNFVVETIEQIYKLIES